MSVEQENDIERPVRTEVKVAERPSRRWWIAVLAFAVVAGVVVSGILPRIQARNTVAKETKEMAIPTIVVVHPKPAAPSKEIILPANVQAYIDSPIYARTNGYLRKWYADIGARVTAGQLLAEIETPEVDQQLRQARADLNTSEANLSLAKITSDRYAGLLKTDSVSKQDTDNAEANYAAQKATVRAMEANVNRLEELQSFEKVYAPCTGVITARRTDIGALIDSGSSGGQQYELFHIAQPDRLRVYVNVPQVYSQAAKPGLTADLVLAEFPGRKFEGKLVRTADAIDQNTRTLLVEISVNNPTGTLFSGAYAEVHLKLPGSVTSFTLPVTTLLFRSEGLRVVTVPDGRHAQLVPITVGRDYGSEIEVVAGVTGDDSVIANPPDFIVSGQEVRIAQPSSATSSSGGVKQ
jgi:RND family efflux transporter MFP subunit